MPYPCSQIVCFEVLDFLQMIHCHQMPFSQIHDVNIITLTGTVLRRIIADENAQLIQFANCYLRDIGQQIVRDPIWTFTKQT